MGLGAKGKRLRLCVFVLFFFSDAMVTGSGDINMSESLPWTIRV